MLTHLAVLRHAKEARVSRHIGRGLNRWSHVNIGDVAELYFLALEKAPAGSFYYVENGESTLLEIARDIARPLNVAGPEACHFRRGSENPGSSFSAVRSWIEQPGACGSRSQ